MRLIARHLYRLSWLIALVTPLLFLAHPSSLPTHGVSAAPAAHTGEQAQGITMASDGTLRLSQTALSAPSAPAVEPSYTYYGMYISGRQPLDKPATQVTITYNATIPQGSALRIALRGSTNGTQWTSWHTDLTSGQQVAFAQPVHMVQYRAVLLAATPASPVLHTVHIVAQPTAPTYHMFQDDQQLEPIAPTYRVYATREGMVGGITANGYVIEPNAWFAALPSWRALCSPGGYEYQVRITHGERSVVVPVWDVGPWNTRDDYWSLHRERYQDLRRGWPEDHAAYFEGYNGGYAEKGLVSYPTAIDVGDGAWYALGLPDGRFEVDVTFLWLAGDDGAPASPPAYDPNASEFVVSETTHNGHTFHAQAAITWYHSPGGCGEENHALWTLTTEDPNHSENQAFWQPHLPFEGEYDVYVHVPICPTNYPVTRAARYLVQHRDGAQEIVVNQAEQTAWVLLGRFPFAAGNAGFVHLRDVAGDTLHTLWYDNVKWVPVPTTES